MIYQNYIECNAYSLFACISGPSEYKQSALLLPGFAHSACDLDFFMSRLRNHLYASGVLTVQLDLYGHGDSQGDIVDFSLYQAIRDIESVLIWMIKQFIHRPIIICRGLLGKLFYDSNLNYSGLLLNPPCIPNRDCQSLKDIFSAFTADSLLEVVEFYHSLREIERRKQDAFWTSLGCDIGNLFGMQMRHSLIEDIIVSLCYVEANKTCKFTIIDTYNHANAVIKRNNIVPHPLDINLQSFVREPFWIEGIISTILNEIENLV